MAAEWAKQAAAPETPLPEPFGPYRFVARLGRGGFGDVYLAEQREPVRRKVALKVLKRGMDSEAILRRFAREQQALARMDHEAVAKFYDAGSTPGGHPYFAMEYVEGQPVADYCEAQRLSLRERLLLFVQVCRGVQHAHQRGVVHRDLKPSNVLVVRRGDAHAPKLIDFGIARALEDDLDGFTRTSGESALGTPAYMAPEQSDPASGQVDTRTDVYALGALKNVGVDAMGLIVAARKTETGAEKPFATLFDFARRVDLKRVGKRPLEMLARAGAFDQLEPNRARVFEALDGLVAYSAAIHEAKASNQVSLFGDSGSDIPEPRLPFRDDWLPVERLGHEHQAVGFYLSGHPLDDYMSALKRKDVKTLAEITARAANGPFVGKLAGSVASKQERKSAKGNRFAFVQLSDPTGLYEVTVFSDVLEQARDYLEPGRNVVLTVKVDPDGDGVKLLANGVQPIDVVAESAGAQAIRIHLNRSEAVASLAALLAKLEGRTRAEVTLCLPDDQGREIDVTLPAAYPVTPQVRGAIKAMQGVVLVEDI